MYAIRSYYVLQGNVTNNELDVWDEQISRMGAYITVFRYNYIKKLNIYAKKLYNEISEKTEELELIYNSSVFDELEGRTDYKGEMAKEYLAKIKSNINDDIKLGFTQTGIHRDDIITKINNLPAKDFASQRNNFV